MKKSICCIALALVMALSTVGLFASCAKEKEKTLVMATNANFPPYEYKDGAAFAGIDVELAQAIADKLGMKLEIQDVEFGAIVAGVESGKYDIGMAGMTVTEDRKKQVSFSTTYATGVQVVIVKEGSAIQSPADITTSSKIGVQQDTTGDLYASDTPEKGGWGEAAVTRYKNFCSERGKDFVFNCGKRIFHIAVITEFTDKSRFCFFRFRNNLFRHFVSEHACVFRHIVFPFKYFFR